MKKVILMPDSFKGTMSSSEICAIMKEKILEHYPDCQIESIPVADGGEGTVDCFLEAMGGEKIRTDCSGPYLETTKSFYAIVDGGETAIIEMAAAAGLPMVAGYEDPRYTTTFGVGRLIRKENDTGVVSILDSRAAYGFYSTKVSSVLSKYPRVDTIEDVHAFMKNVKTDSYFENQSSQTEV